MPSIIITGCGDMPMTVSAMKAGAVEFLTKPIDDELLLDAIAQALSSAGEPCWKRNPDPGTARALRLA